MLSKRFLKFLKALRRSLSQRKAQFNTAHLIRFSKTLLSKIFEGLKRIYTSQGTSKDLRVFDRSYKHGYILAQEGYKLVRKALYLKSKEVYTTVPNVGHIPPFIFDYRVVLYEGFILWQALTLYWRKFVKRLIPITLIFLLFSPFTVFAQSQSPRLNVGTPEEQASPSTKVEIVTTEAPIFQKPVEGEVSQKFSFYHPAIDIMKSYGSPVKAVADGKVEKAGWELGYGKTVIIAHEEAFKTRYAHLSEIKVKEGESVGKETTIGKIGLTGWTSGPHLHFEVSSNGKRINPLDVLPGF